MRVILLGTGAAAPDPERGGSAILISLGEHHYLFDCGPGATRQLVKAQVSPAEVGTVFLSHLHFDHIADFPYFLLTGWILDRARPSWSARRKRKPLSITCSPTAPSPRTSRRAPGIPGAGRSRRLRGAGAPYDRHSR